MNNTIVKFMSLAVLLLLPLSFLNAELPDAVDNSTDPLTSKYFPPIGDQGSLGSCGPFSAVYYMLTYATAKAHDWTASDGSKNFSPKFIYNMINGGGNVGTYLSDSYAMMDDHGSPLWSTFPYQTSSTPETNFREWSTDKSVWREAINYRISNYGFFDTYTATDDDNSGIIQLKEYINNGYILNYWTGISDWQYKTVSDNPATGDDDEFIGEKACYQVTGNDGGHFMTCVGYNDNIWIDINGDAIKTDDEVGAIKIANSWGTGWSNGNAGFCWVAYEILRDSKPGSWPALDNFFWMEAPASYSPKVVAEVTVNQLKRNQMSLRLGIGNVGTATPSSEFIFKACSEKGGEYAFDGTTTAIDGTFVFDFTDIVPDIEVDKRWFLKGYDSTSGDALQIKSYRIINIEQDDEEIISSSHSFPITVDNTTIYPYVDYSRPALIPYITLNKTAITHTILEGESISDDTFTIKNGGVNTINYTVSEDISFLSCNPVSGSSTGEEDSIAIQYSGIASLSPGIYSGTITVSAPEAANPKTIDITINVCFPISFTDFEEGDNDFGDWSNKTGDDCDWINHTGVATPAPNLGKTGPSGAAEGSRYILLKTVSINNPYKTALLETGDIDLTNYESTELTFYYHMYGVNASQMGDLSVEVYNDSAWSSSIFTLSGNQQSAYTDSWKQAIVNLTPYCGKVIKLRLRGVSGSGWTSDIAVDEILIQGIPLYALTVTDGTGDDSYVSGTVVNISANAPPANSHFDGWTGGTGTYGNASLADTTYTTMAVAETITATFALDTYTVTFDVESHGSRNGGGALEQTIAHGSAATAPTITANAGWMFDGWDVTFGNITSILTVTAQYNINGNQHLADDNPADWSLSQTEVNDFIADYANNSNIAGAGNGDITPGRITMRETLRVIYLYNGGGAYKVDGGTVDGYALDGAAGGDAGSAPPELEQGNTITVANSADSGVGSFRDAIANAAHGDTIIFDGSIEKITLTSEILIDKSLTLDGSGVTIISGDATTRIFQVYNENEDLFVLILNLGIVDGKNSTDKFGGAIYNNGEDLTLENCLLNGNRNTFAGGQGGAIYTSGTLSVINSVFTDNSAEEEDDVFSVIDRY